MTDIDQEPNNNMPSDDCIDSVLNDARPSDDFLRRCRMIGECAKLLRRMQAVHKRMEAQVFAPAPLLQYVKALAVWAGVGLDQLFEWLGFSEADLQHPNVDQYKSYVKLGIGVGMSQKQLVYRIGEAIASERGEPIALLAQSVDGMAHGATLTTCYDVLEYAVASWDQDNRDRFTDLRNLIVTEYNRYGQ